MFHRILFSLSLLGLSISAAQAAETNALNTPRLTNADNFRDLAGTQTAYTTSHNGTLRSGVLYRSNALTVTPGDLATLNTLNISNVFDLRTPDEIATAPDILPTGAAYTNINVAGTAYADFSLTTAAASIALMEGGERAFVTDPGIRSEFGLLMRELASSENAALFHCTAGKDRTGWTAAILQTLAGVDQATVMADYLATNTYTAERVAATYAQLNALSPEMAAAYQPLLGVQASFLQAGLDQVVASYGSMDNYLKQGLGLDQETIYVLRGKLVRYSILPGQQDLSGNDAAGAGLLNALQDSSLSGTYSAYNYYLQSAIDAGSLGGLQSQVGGQVHADAGAYLLRQSAQIDDALSPYAVGSNLKTGESSLWITALAGYLGTDSSSKAASSNEHSAGSMVGGVHRLNERTSANVAFGYNKGTVRSADAEAKSDSTFLSAGGRYAFDSLESGAYLALQVEAGYIDYSSKRDLNANLGTARGDTHGSFYGAKGSLGYRLSRGPLSIEPEIGLRTSQLNLDGFQEKGSELALNVDHIDQTLNSLVSGVKLGFESRTAADWLITPGLSVGYEHMFNDPSVTSSATVLGLGIDQVSAFSSRDLFNAGMNISAVHHALTLGADVNLLNGGESSGLAGQLSASIAF
ncbi:tyrosine-protein phosphatase [Pseudomonas sp. EL_65y_Pfl2_R95]|uniref:tyrosine-protein phosphatase n=1 Tax=Pseudomonas sp. EL_65y_Pfl2_R95 TaxID=3088698 RepID=UPI0030DB1D7A